VKESIIKKVENDFIHGLDVQILNDYVLSPILGIKNPKTDKNIDFVGGDKGLEELEYRCRFDSKVAFALNPVEIDDIVKVANARMIMPPKSTWFYPKPRSGFVIYKYM
jgi:uncharacterized protein (DUF1015 family)